MERIREAVERAKESRRALEEKAPLQSPHYVAPASRTKEAIPQISPARPVKGRVVRLDAQHLESMRIVAEDAKNPLARGFELLRTQLFVRMNQSNMRTIGVTSPTPGCGKTVCSLNLAFSFARLVQRSITLVDFDLRKPQVATYLGLQQGMGVESLLRGKAAIGDVAIYPEASGGRLRILPTFSNNRDPTHLISSPAMVALINEVKAQSQDSFIIFDLPPVLAVDDVLQILPHIDLVLMVVAAGQSTASEIRNAERMLGTSKPVEILLNKAEEVVDTEYHYY